MARRRSGFADLLAGWPWWASLLLAGVSYALLAWGAPRLEVANPFLQPLLKTAAPLLAPLLALAFLAIAAASALMAWRRRALLDRQQDLESVRQTTWQDFERLVGEIYRREGYRVIETGGGGADGGVDLRLAKDGATWLVQCKRWRREPVGVKVVRELYGVVAAERATGGILITTSTFTPDAVAFARGHPLQLVPGDELLRRIRTVQKGAQPAAVAADAPACPTCGAAMVRRVARQGKNAGQTFWGCSRFPACRAVRSIP
jgi:restriction system protein